MRLRTIVASPHQVAECTTQIRKREKLPRPISDDLVPRGLNFCTIATPSRSFGLLSAGAACMELRTLPRHGSRAAVAMRGTRHISLRPDISKVGQRKQLSFCVSVERARTQFPGRFPVQLESLRESVSARTGDSAPPEYVGRDVWVPWDSRAVRLDQAGPRYDVLAK